MDHSPGFLALVTEAKKDINECSVQEAWRKAQDEALGTKIFLIDVREESEFAAGHAKHATHLGRGILERDIEAKVPDKEAEILLYCGGGYRSALSARNLILMGYKRVWSVAGGFRAWQDQELPIDK
ncbi:MAG: sulfurtransferase [Myxococcales bacterium]|nr:MAG: sulfurtransferase [Myxococcales bacterium]